MWCFVDERPRRVAMRGEIDLNTRPQLAGAYRELARLAPADVVVDLADVTFIGCVGLELVVRLTAHLEPTGHTLVIDSPSPPARRLLELTGFL
ncbi:anti-sigma factor antagonist [Nocardia yunnanensis]|uniref:Anti-sigma factor antagonist n=1 Tax=Nocardia yunnanensis TaxID=2382165 RepID=A0A386ZJW8_9NOCA|nr:anti-sigma factor antagonist [Nocardia yunnanensis]